jgi:hypothetical protein
MENQTSPIARPTFLTVLCIISFVGLGLSILNNFSSFVLSSAGSWLYSIVQEGLEKALQQASSTDPGAAVFLEHMFDAILKLIEVLPLLAGLTLVCSTVALAGVLFMWKLKKSGFYLYSGAKGLLVFLPILLIGFNLLSVLISIGTFIGAAIFITLYALNLKAMK